MFVVAPPSAGVAGGYAVAVADGLIAEIRAPLSNRAGREINGIDVHGIEMEPVSTHHPQVLPVVEKRRRR